MVNRRILSKIEVAGLNLSRALELYPDISQRTRETLKKDMMDVPDIAHMNMPVLAAALVFLLASGGEINTQTVNSKLFNDAIAPLDPGPTISPKERETMILRYKASVFRYIVFLTYKKILVSSS